MALFPPGLRRLLLPLSLLYAIGQRRDRRRKLAARYRSALPVISIGNLSVGGSGKTPLAIYLVELLQRESSVLLLSRGYGRKESEPVIWNAGEPLPSAEQLGDEPSLIARSLHRGAVAVAADRGWLLSRIEARFTDAVVLLDDGFQHHRLSRDLDIVLVDDRTAEHPWLLPAGDLREPPAALRRAGIVLATSEKGERFARRWMAEDAELFRIRFRGDPPRRWTDRAAFPGESRSLLVTGIAQSGRVVASLKELGITPASHLRFPDHHAYRSSDVRLILRSMKRSGATQIITTAKDAVKLERFAEAGDLLYVVDLRVEIDDESRFLERVRSAIDSIR
jgi:tetraacyldisaccharide 4'-kinase